MARKLSDAQYALLAKMADGQIVMRIGGRRPQQFLSGERGHVAWATTSVLERLWLIESFRPAAHSIDTDFRITDAGRAALAARKTEGE